MKIKDTYSLKEVGDIYMIFPVGQNVVDYNNIIRLNRSAYFMAQKMLDDISEDELLADMAYEFDATPEELGELRQDMNAFIDKLRSRKILE